MVKTYYSLPLEPEEAQTLANALHVYLTVGILPDKEANSARRLLADVRALFPEQG